MEHVSTSPNSLPVALKAVVGLVGLVVVGLIALLIWGLASYATNPDNVWYAGMDRSAAGAEISKVIGEQYPSEATSLILVSRSHSNYAGREAWRFVFRRPRGDGRLCGFAWSSYQDTSARVGPCR